MIPSPERCVACGGTPHPGFARGDVTIVRCAECGLEWRRPFPDEVALDALYAGGYFARWGLAAPGALARVRAAKQASYREFLAALPRFPPGARLLDLGCAFGFLLAVAQERGLEAYGLDVNPEAVAEARREFGERIHAGPLDERAFPGVRFHAITLVDVLEHVPDPVGLLARVRERLAEGGVVLAVLPNVASLTRRLLGARWPHYAPEHLFHWTPDAIRRLAASHGWRVRSLHTGIRKTYTTAYLRAYASTLGIGLPPGFGVLERLGIGRVRLPTGEMRVLLARAESS